MPGRAQKQDRPSVPIQRQPAGKGGKPDAKNGRDRIRPGNYPKARPGWDGPSRILKDDADD